MGLCIPDSPAAVVGLCRRLYHCVRPKILRNIRHSNEIPGWVFQDRRYAVGDRARKCVLMRSNNPTVRVGKHPKTLNIFRLRSLGFEASLNEPRAQCTVLSRCAIALLMAQRRHGGASCYGAGGPTSWSLMCRPVCESTGALFRASQWVL